LQEVRSGGGYISQSDLRLHFGLGSATQADTVEVRWPGGLKQSFRNVEANKSYVIEEGSEELHLQRVGARGVRD